MIIRVGIVVCVLVYIISVLVVSRYRHYARWGKLSKYTGKSMKYLRRIHSIGINEYYQSCKCGFSMTASEKDLVEGMFCPNILTVRLPIKDIITIYQASKYRCFVYHNYIILHLGDDVETFISRFSKLYLKYNSNDPDIQTKLDQIRSQKSIKISPTEEDANKYDDWFFIEFYRAQKVYNAEINASQYRLGMITASSLIPILHRDVDALQEEAFAELTHATGIISDVAESISRLHEEENNHGES